MNTTLKLPMAMLYICKKIMMIFLTILLGVIGAPEVVLLILAALLLFGGKKIPELMKGLGSGVKEFKNAVKDESDNPPNIDKNQANVNLKDSQN